MRRKNKDSGGKGDHRVVRRVNRGNRQCGGKGRRKGFTVLVMFTNL